MPNEEEAYDRQQPGHRPHEQAEPKKHGTARNGRRAINLFSATAIANALPGLADFLRAAAVVAIVVFVFLKWPFVSAWLNSISHFEGFGAKIDRAAVQEQLGNVAAVSKQNNLTFDEPFAQAALIRAEAVSPALVGARLLWVDQHPQNNAPLVSVLQGIGISVQLALNTEDGITFAKMERPSKDQIFDLVITNQSRPEDKTRPVLKKCPAVYFEFPDKTVRDEFGGDDQDQQKNRIALSKFNLEAQDHPSAGFALAEEFAQTFPEQFADTQKSRVIMFTAASGGISASACVRIVTNRYDVLLQSVIGALEEFRGNLITRPQPSPSPAQEAAALQGQADLIYQTARLAVCRNDAKNCLGK